MFDGFLSLLLLTTERSHTGLLLHRKVELYTIKNLNHVLVRFFKLFVLIVEVRCGDFLFALDFGFRL